MIGRVKKVLKRARGRWRWGRRHVPIEVAGRAFRRSRDQVEIDITWACNLRCNNCNRSCQQAPTGIQMDLAQIQRFVQESVAAGKRWRRIRVLGGEPLLHPQVLGILDVLRAWRSEHHPEAVIELATNGHGDKVRSMLAQVPGDIVVENSEKTTDEQVFLPFNHAPVDDPELRRSDFRHGCWVTENCGVGLTPHGWYPCAVAGGIDRVVGLGVGRPSLPLDSDDLDDQLDELCRWCGGFDPREVPAVTQPSASPSWKRAYSSWRAGPVALRRYGDGDEST